MLTGIQVAVGLRHRIMDTLGCLGDGIIITRMEIIGDGVLEKRSNIYSEKCLYLPLNTMLAWTENKEP